MPKKIIVIGAGFAGLSAASFLKQKGFDVTILEKNKEVGGRARKFESNGFVFDMGPSWYWMPDVFERYFAQFGKNVSDYYELKRLDPGYQVYFDENDAVSIPATLDKLEDLFESLEPGSKNNLRKFLKEAEYKYNVGISEFVFKPGNSILEFADLRVLSSVFRLQMFQSMSAHVSSLFSNPKIKQLLEFPVLFLGATPWKTPAMYSLMNYADLVLGTWYPMGGMNKIIEGMTNLALELGVEIRTSENVRSIHCPNGSISEVHSDLGVFSADIVVGGADYHHIDQELLEKRVRSYSPKYWDNRTMAPSSLIFYLGVNKKLKNLQHHNLFFDRDFKKHAIEIYDSPQWPSDPLFYICCPSKTDNSVAPPGHENLFILIPVAPGLEDTAEIREKYFKLVLERIKKITGENISKNIVFQRSYAHKDFKSDYNSFKGNAYGLANTLDQTAFLKPKLRSKKLSNLYFSGQLTTPGPGVPPSLISGEVVANEIFKTYKP